MDIDDREQPNTFLDTENTSLTMAVLEEAIALLPKCTYPKTMKISYSDYSRIIENLPPPKESIISWPWPMGMQIVPDIDIPPGSFELEY